MNRLTLSHSSIADFQACSKIFLHRKVNEMVPRRPKKAFVVGTAFDRRVTAWRDGKPYEEEKLDTSLLTVEEIADLEIEKARAEAMAKAYTGVYASDRTEFKTIKTQQELTAELLDGVNYTGVIDEIVELPDGSWWILERKTASRVDDGYWDRLPLDSQILGYVWLVKEALGITVDGVIYDVALKTSHRQTQKENLSQFCDRLTKIHLDPAKRVELYQRRRIPIGRNLVNDWRKEMFEVGLEIRRNLELGPDATWPRRSAQCNTMYGPCPYLEACLSGGYAPHLYMKDPRLAKKEKDGDE